MPKALVVDDSNAIRIILSRTLQELGYEVSQACDGIEALRIMESCGNSVSLVLADWNMPGMNGLELLRLLRQDPSLSSLVIVMVTTEAELGQMDTALRAGANEYVMKPFTREILLGKLQLAGIHS